MTKPTDAEIEALAEEHLDAVQQFGRLWIEGQAAFARAVLAKWGHPLAGAGGEPVTKERYSEPLARVINAGYLLSNCAFNLAQRPGTEISLGTAQTLEACQKEWDAACAAHKALPPAPPPQAVREPREMTQLEYARLQAISLDYSDSEDECTGFRDGWRSAEKHYGITKGGQ